MMLRINPTYYSFNLLCASEHGGRLRTPKQWSQEFGLAALTNASMYYRESPLKSTGYMKNYQHINNSRINQAFGAFMVFNPKNSDQAAVRMIDRHLENDWEQIINDYDTVVQNYRMISAGKKRGWPQQNKEYRNAAIAVDKEENVLFILGRAAQSTHDFIHILLALPIGIETAMYVEGGHEAILYLDRGSGKAADPPLDDLNASLSGNEDLAWTLPNVIGISKRKSNRDDLRMGK
jgi:hypothetical protein